MSSQAHATGLTYDDLAAFPDDGLRRELIGGQLIVTPAPRPRHQLFVVELTTELNLHARTHGGQVFCAPLDVYFAHDDVAEPDVLYLLPQHLDRVEDKFVRGAPDLVVEMSSPSTRHLDLVRKRNLYERYGVPEYWYADLDTEAVHAHRLADGTYGDPTVLKCGETLTSPLLPGFAIRIDDLFAAPPGWRRPAR
ncbi:MAG: Uma2 family endonuclease [Egibacteraceae bacterium]